VRSLFRKFWYVTAVAILCFASSAFADTANLTFTGGTYNGVVGPYNFTVGGQPTTLICDDDRAYIQGGESWTADVVTVQEIINTGIIPATPANSNIGGATVLDYEEAAYLTLQLFTVYHNHGDTTNIQWAIWDLFDGGSGESGADPEGGDAAWLASALAAVNAGGIDYSNVRIYTWDGNTDTLVDPVGADPPQQFTGVAEASTSALLGVGVLSLIALIAVFRRGKLRTAQ